MSKEALLKLREPAAFALLGAGALQLLAGLVSLFGSGGFTYNALQETAGYGFFTSLTIAVVAVLAVLFVTKGAEQHSPQARNVVLGALGVLGLGLVLGVVCLLSGLVASSPFCDCWKLPPVFISRKQPVPYVFLAMPSRKQAWPKSAACWSPATPAMGTEAPSKDACVSP